MSKMTTVSNTARIPLDRLLCLLHSSLPTLTGDNIRAARYRARKAGLPDPHPYVIREVGVPYTLADLGIYNQTARIKGWPLVQVEDLSGGGAR